MENSIDNGKSAGSRYETDSRGVFGIRRLALVQLVEGGSDRNGEIGPSSVTLVKTSTSTIIVDSGTPDVSERISSGLESIHLPLEKVNVLVTTCPKENYTGNDHLFTHALQHIAGEDWGLVEMSTGRRVGIHTPVHWIDKYVKILKKPFPADGSLAIIFHVPSVVDILEPSTIPFAGKVIGIAGGMIETGDDDEISGILSEIGGNPDIKRPKEIHSLRDMLLYCDFIIPGRGPIFPTRSGN
ncbi:MAG: hypothetical protein ACMUIG_06595 [Thermoplasmatota archaeon]